MFAWAERHCGASTTRAPCLVDGDIVQQFLALPFELQATVAEDVQVGVQDLVKVVMDVAWLRWPSSMPQQL
jgi:hypothetical protein